MKQILPLLLLTLLIGCNSVKSVQKSINKGNYDTAIYTAVKYLQDNKSSKKAQEHKVLLQNAFEKASEKDLQRIAFLKKDNNPNNLEGIFELYNSLKNRQNKIRPLLPLELPSGKTVNFKFNDYTDEIITSKKKLVSHLYEKSQKVIYNASSKIEIRKAYEDLKYVNDLHNGYKNVSNLMQEAHFKGTDYVLMSLKNQTNQIIPARLQNDLLRIDTYGLDDFWTVYHTSKNTNTSYDYKLALDFKNIQISPERIREKDFVKEKDIKEPYYVKDSKGNRIKKYRTIRARSHFYEIRQLKTCNISAQVQFFNYNTNSLLETFPLQSGFVFEHAYGTQKGDKRALENIFIEMLGLREVPFPSNEQMVYDAGQDLKEKLKSVIRNNKF